MVDKPKQARIISSTRDNKLVKQGCLACFSHITNVEIVALPIGSNPIVFEFGEMFPNNLTCMPLDRDKYF